MCNSFLVNMRDCGKKLFANMRCKLLTQSGVVTRRQEKINEGSVRTVIHHEHRADGLSAASIIRMDRIVHIRIEVDSIDEIRVNTDLKRSFVFTSCIFNVVDGCFLEYLQSEKLFVRISLSESNAGDRCRGV